MTRKTFNKDFKARVAIEAIKGDRTVNQIASEFDVHPTQVNQWKKALLEGAGDIFSVKKEKREQSVEEEKDVLYQQIGKLQVEVDWLKKKTGLLR